MLHGICHFWLVLLFAFVGCQEFISWYATFSFSEDAIFFWKCGDNLPVEKHDNFMLQLQGAIAGQIHQVHTRCRLTERDLKGWF